MLWLSRPALQSVLQSLLTAELASCRQRQSPNTPNSISPAVWPATLVMGESDTPALGCDSLERIWLAAAVNEMFCLYETGSEDNLLSAPTFGDWLDIVEAGWQTNGRRITFTTSGSRGAPKRCSHERGDLHLEVRYLAQLFANARRIIALTPPHHIYGFLFTAMLPTFLGIPVLRAETLSPGVLSRELAAGDVVVSVPPRWEWLARSIPCWPEGVRGITSTAPCPDPLKTVLMESGLSGFTEVYGSSETGGVGVRSWPETRYTLMSHWDWDLAEPTPALLHKISGRRVCLQDDVRLQAEGKFTVESRKDGAVQVGGVNVFPGRLETLLRSQPGVADAAVRLSSVIGRQRLKAFIVPDGTLAHVTLAAALDTWTQQFPAPERIRSFTFGPAVPSNEMGKSADW